MKAVVCYGKNELRLEDIPKPEVRLGHVVIEVAASGICGSDHSIFSGNGPWWTKYPIVPGHELSGVVEEVGDGVDRVKVGDEVAVDNYLHCGGCWYCKNGHYFLCDNHTEIGFTINGGFAEYCFVPVTNVVKIPEGISVVDAAITENVATALRACRLSGISFGDEILVLGCGPLGYLIAQICTVMGGRVTLVGRGARMDRIAELNAGIDALVDISKQDWVREVKGRTGERGVDVIFEVTGSETMIYPSIDLLKKKGKLILLGITWGKTSQIFIDPIVLKEIEIHGRISGQGFFAEALVLLQTGKVDPRKNITHRFSLDRYQDALRYEAERLEGAIKVVMTPEFRGGI